MNKSPKTTKSPKTPISHWVVVGVLTVMFALQGLANIGAQALVDESFWTYGRVEKFWDNIAERDWYNARTGDNKPGVTVAIAAGAGLLQYDNTKALKKADLTPDERRALLTAFRVPLFLSIVALLPIFYLVLRKLLTPWSALFGFCFITLSPLLLGMSRIVNPDALFWILTPLALLFALIFGAQTFDHTSNSKSNIKSNSLRYAVIAGVFGGLALLTKYTATILFLLLPTLIIIGALWYRANDTDDLRKYLRKSFIGFGIFVVVALLTIIILYPATWAKPERILLVSFWSPPLIELWKIILAVYIFIWLDLFVTRVSRIAQILMQLRKLRNILLGAFVTVTLLTIIFVLTDAWWWQLVDYQALIASPKSALLKLGFSAFPLGIAANWYTLLFGLPIAALGGIVWICAKILAQIIKGTNKETNKRVGLAQNQAITLLLLLTIWVYYIGIVASGVVGTVRYQIITYPLALIIAGIGIVDFAQTLMRLIKSKLSNLRKTNWKFAQKLTLWLVLIVIVASGIYALRSVSPYYFSYANTILPPGQVLNLKDMGDGSYQMAMYLNKLPNARTISIWSDKNGVCRFFVGKCSTNVKVLRKSELRAQIDYFVISTSRTNRTITLSHGNPFVRKLYTSNTPTHTITPGNNPSNTIKLLPNN